MSKNVADEIGPCRILIPPEEQMSRKASMMRFLNSEIGKYFMAIHYLRVVLDGQITMAEQLHELESVVRELDEKLLELSK